MCTTGESWGLNHHRVSAHLGKGKMQQKWGPGGLERVGVEVPPWQVCTVGFPADKLQDSVKC